MSTEYVKTTDDAIREANQGNEWKRFLEGEKGVGKQAVRNPRKTGDALRVSGKQRRIVQYG